VIGDVDPAGLVAYSRWITPEAIPVRFDTFFAHTFERDFFIGKNKFVQLKRCPCFEPQAGFYRRSDALRIVFRRR